MTVDAVRARTKTVTRRHVDTWKDLAPGARLTLVEKAMGLPKGARQVVLADVEIVRVSMLRLGLYPSGPYKLSPLDQAELDREGLGHLTVDEFLIMWLQSHGYTQWVGLGSHGLAQARHQVYCRRIEWRYLDG
jgi:hypothetical protein